MDGGERAAVGSSPRQRAEERAGLARAPDLAPRPLPEGSAVGREEGEGGAAGPAHGQEGGAGQPGEHLGEARLKPKRRRRRRR